MAVTAAGARLPAFWVASFFAWWACSTATASSTWTEEQKCTLKTLNIKAMKTVKTRVPLSAGIHETPTCVAVQSCRSPAACRWSFLPGWRAWPESAGKGAHLKKIVNPISTLFIIHYFGVITQHLFLLLRGGSSQHGGCERLLSLNVHSWLGLDRKTAWERDNSQITDLDRNWTTGLVLCSYLLEGDRLHHLRVGVSHTGGIFVRWHIAGARDPHWGTMTHRLRWGWMLQNKTI